MKRSIIIALVIVASLAALYFTKRKPAAPTMDPENLRRLQEIQRIQRERPPPYKGDDPRPMGAHGNRLAA